jgi:hypothetical protein
VLALLIGSADISAISWLQLLARSMMFTVSADDNCLTLPNRDDMKLLPPSSVAAALTAASSLFKLRSNASRARFLRVNLWRGFSRLFLEDLVDDMVDMDEHEVGNRELFMYDCHDCLAGLREKQSHIHTVSL